MWINIEKMNTQNFGRIIVKTHVSLFWAQIVYVNGLYSWSAYTTEIINMLKIYTLSQFTFKVNIVSQHEDVLTVLFPTEKMIENLLVLRIWEWGCRIICSFLAWWCNRGRGCLPLTWCGSAGSWLLICWRSQRLRHPGSWEHWTSHRVMTSDSGRSRSEWSGTGRSRKSPRPSEPVRWRSSQPTVYGSRSGKYLSTEIHNKKTMK